MKDLTATEQTTLRVRVVMHTSSNAGAVALDKVQILGE